ncbi:MAG: hypothetical protein WED00_05655 [Aquisalimonadaceae bacterium]
MIRSIFAVVFLATIGTIAWNWLSPPDELTIDVPEGLTAEEREIVTNALSKFSDTCVALFGANRHTIESFRADFRDAMPYRAERYGWDRELALDVRVAEDARIAGGHRIIYYLGDGHSPGWVTQKKEGAQLCGRTGNSGQDTFVETSGLQVRQ